MTINQLQPGTEYHYIDHFVITPVTFIGRSFVKPKLFRFENPEGRMVTIDEFYLAQVFESASDARLCLRELLTNRLSQVDEIT